MVRTTIGICVVGCKGIRGMFVIKLEVMLDGALEVSVGAGTLDRRTLDVINAVFEIKEARDKADKLPTPADARALTKKKNKNGRIV